MTIDMIHQMKDAANMLEFDDRIVGMWLVDLRSYWNLWKLVGRRWRYQYEIWL